MFTKNEAMKILVRDSKADALVSKLQYHLIHVISTNVSSNFDHYVSNQPYQSRIS